MLSNIKVPSVFLLQHTNRTPLRFIFARFSQNSPAVVCTTLKEPSKGTNKIFYQFRRRSAKNPAFYEAYLFSNALTRRKFELSTRQRADSTEYPVFVSAERPNFTYRVSLVCLVPAGCVSYGWGSTFSKRSTFQSWLELMLLGAERKVLRVPSVSRSLLTLSLMFLQSKNSLLCESTWPAISVLFKYCLDLLSSEPDQYRRYKTVGFLIKALYRMSINHSGLFDHSQISGRLYEHLPECYKSVMAAVSQPETGMHINEYCWPEEYAGRMTFMKHSLLEMLFMMDWGLQRTVKSFASWNELKFIVQDELQAESQNSVPEPQSIKVVNYKNISRVRLSNLAARWCVNDREFWTHWFDYYFNSPPVDSQAIVSFRLEAQAVAVCIDVLLKCSAMDCLGLVNDKQKSQLLDAFAANVNFLVPFVAGDLKNLITQNLAFQRFDFFDEKSMTILLNTLNSYRPAKIVFLDYKETESK